MRPWHARAAPYGAPTSTNRLSASPFVICLVAAGAIRRASPVALDEHVDLLLAVASVIVGLAFPARFDLENGDAEVLAIQCVPQEVQATADRFDRLGVDFGVGHRRS